MSESARASRTWMAWGVHCYTASGLIAAAGISVSIVGGTPRDFALAFLLMLVATFIDSTDGWMARRVGVKTVLPHFDGRRLDDIIDYLNYTFLPVLLMWRAEVLPPEWAFVHILVLLASVYGFCQEDAKTADGYFLGFPSYWNVVALYLYYLEVSAPAAAVTLTALALLTFVPTRYLYPSQQGTLNTLTCVLGVIWGAVLVVFLLGRMGESPQGPGGLLLGGSLLFPLYYMVASFAVEFAQRRTSRRITD